MSALSLEVIAGPATGTRLSVSEPLVIGREGSGEGSLGADSQLSRRHARVSVFGGDRLLVEDLGSTNGTFVNGAQIDGPTVLSPGDTIAVGDTTVRVMSVAEAAPAAERPPSSEPVSELELGGVHTVPSDLFSLLVSRAPVRREWIIRGALTALPIILAANFIIRTVATEYLDVPSDIALFKPHVLIFVSVMPVIGSSFGFYKNFGRPANHSPLRYMIPGFFITAAICTVELITLPADAGAVEYLVTMLITLVAPTVLIPILLGLRVRAALATEARLRGGKAA